MSADTYEIPKSNIPIPERVTYIPSWYDPHEDLSLPVLDENDGMLGFTIGAVLPERRWAIREDGRLMPQHLFEQRYRQWIERTLAPNGAIIEIKRFNKYFDVGLESVPGVDDFVDAKPDASQPVTDGRYIRYVAISYNPLEADKGRRKIRPIYTHTGEKAESAEQVAPPVGFDAVVEPKKAKKPAEVMVAMPCGKEAKAKFQHNHKRLCKACKALAAEVEQKQADAEATAAA